MKKCKISIINAIIAGIFICGMLAACGVAEKRYAAPDAGSSAASSRYSAEIVGTDIPDHISSHRAKN